MAAVVRRLRSEDVFLLAAGLSFYALVSVVPFAVLVLWLVSLITGKARSTRSLVSWQPSWKAPLMDADCRLPGGGSLADPPSTPHHVVRCLSQDVKTAHQRRITAPSNSRNGRDCCPPFPMIVWRRSSRSPRSGRR